ncbi:hypothetical protein ACLPJK_25650 [Pseudomonas aeruginosa]|uniref:DUF7941 domain-family protein n=1 Tax=Pseudomonas aeruginosa TaxID=287 RepID=UPI003D28E818
MELDKSKNSLLNFIDLVNDSNPNAHLTVDDFSGVIAVDSLAPATNQEAQSPRNTMIALSANGPGFAGAKTLYYRRLDLVEAGIKTQIDIPLAGRNPQDSDDFISLMNELYANLGLLDEPNAGVSIYYQGDVVSMQNKLPFPTSGGSVEVSVRAPEFSLIYLNTPVTLTIINTEVPALTVLHTYTAQTTGDDDYQNITEASPTQFPGVSSLRCTLEEYYPDETPQQSAGIDLRASFTTTDYATVVSFIRSVTALKFGPYQSEGEPRAIINSYDGGSGRIYTVVVRYPRIMQQNTTTVGNETTVDFLGDGVGYPDLVVDYRLVNASISLGNSGNEKYALVADYNIAASDMGDWVFWYNNASDPVTGAWTLRYEFSAMSSSALSAVIERLLVFAWGYSEDDLVIMPQAFIDQVRSGTPAQVSSELGSAAGTWRIKGSFALDPSTNQDHPQRPDDPYTWPLNISMSA